MCVNNSSGPEAVGMGMVLANTQQMESRGYCTSQSEDPCPLSLASEFHLPENFAFLVQAHFSTCQYMNHPISSRLMTHTHLAHFLQKEFKTISEGQEVFTF